MAYVDKGLTGKQIKFCLEYMKDYNGTQAAIRAGYSEDTAAVQASRMLKKDKIVEFIDNLMAKDIEVTTDYVLARLMSIAEGKGKESDKLKAIELLGKYKAMFTDKVQQTGETEIVVSLPDKKKETPTE